MTRITFLGGVGEVTGSCYLFESPSFGKVLLECGMRQGSDDTDDITKGQFSFDAKSIDAVILSHAHLDHSGMLPRLVSGGFGGPIYCTAATRDLLVILLKDAFGLYERDLERENRYRQRAGREEIEPAYSIDDVERVLSQCVGMEYHEMFTAGDGLRVRFLDAGHILGSAIVELMIAEHGRERRLVFSGDLGSSDPVLMRDPEVPERADVVMMESTYGDRNHRSMEATIDQFTQILHETWEMRGNVMIPAFAIGRTQEILFHLGLLYHQGNLDRWQVYLDSPMAIAVTQVYDRWVKLLDREDTRHFATYRRESLEKFLPTLSLCESVEDSMSINRVDSGAIIIAGSGMCTGGRIRHHIKHRIWKQRNTMIFVGFQARGTLGRALVDGAKNINMFGHEYAVHARIETLGGFSAHAGQSELISWVDGIEDKSDVVLVHGEPSAIDTLADKLKREKGIRARVPSLGDSMVL